MGDFNSNRGSTNGFHGEEIKEDASLGSLDLNDFDVDTLLPILANEDALAGLSGGQDLFGPRVASSSLPPAARSSMLAQLANQPAEQPVLYSPAGVLHCNLATGETPPAALLTQCEDSAGLNTSPGSLPADSRSWDSFPVSAPYAGISSQQQFQSQPAWPTNSWAQETSQQLPGQEASPVQQQQQQQQLQVARQNLRLQQLQQQRQQRQQQSQQQRLQHLREHQAQPMAWEPPLGRSSLRRVSAADPSHSSLSNLLGTSFTIYQSQARPNILPKEEATLAAERLRSSSMAETSAPSLGDLSTESRPKSAGSSLGRRVSARMEAASQGATDLIQRVGSGTAKAFQVRISPGFSLI